MKTVLQMVSYLKGSNIQISQDTHGVILSNSSPNGAAVK